MQRADPLAFRQAASRFATGVAVSMINFTIISVLAFRRSQTVLVV